MTPVLLIVGLLLTLAVVQGVLFGRQLPKPYRARPCQGRGWKHQHPSASKHEIRSFLQTFVEAFAYSNSERLKFGPGDEIIQVYRAMYPHRWTPDALEIETLAHLVNERYGVSLESIWSEHLTLGALFDQCVRHEATGSGA